VFVPFQRLGDTDNTTGVGLGLALSRGLTEWHLLEVLLRHPGKLLSQRQLLAEVWGPATPTRPVTSACT
jgi:DNA-binding response OmpR family regulator